MVLTVFPCDRQVSQNLIKKGNLMIALASSFLPTGGLPASVPLVLPAPRHVTKAELSVPFLTPTEPMYGWFETAAVAVFASSLVATFYSFLVAVASLP
jgi:hypothetical protein